MFNETHTHTLLPALRYFLTRGLRNSPALSVTPPKLTLRLFPRGVKTGLASSRPLRIRSRHWLYTVSPLLENHKKKGFVFFEQVEKKTTLMRTDERTERMECEWMMMLFVVIKGESLYVRVCDTNRKQAGVNQEHG